MGGIFSLETFDQRGPVDLVEEGRDVQLDDEQFLVFTQLILDVFCDDP